MEDGDFLPHVAIVVVVVAAVFAVIAFGRSRLGRKLKRAIGRKSSRRRPRKRGSAR